MSRVSGQAPRIARRKTRVNALLPARDPGSTVTNASKRPRAPGCSLALMRSLRRDTIPSSTLHAWMTQFHGQARNVAEIGHVVGYQNRATADGMRGDHPIIVPSPCPTALSYNLTVSLGSRGIERQDRDAAQQNLQPNLPYGREGRIPVETAAATPQGSRPTAAPRRHAPPVCRERHPCRHGRGWRYWCR